MGSRKIVADVVRSLWVMLIWLATAGSAWAAAANDWLYTVELPVQAQSEAERQRAASEGLLIVLTRLTGLTSIPRSETITSALARPQDYYSQFGFSTKRVEDERQGYVDITYTADALRGLISEAGLPVWWSTRPQLFAWIVSDEGGDREILASDSEHPVLQALQQHAQLRGLPVKLPLMDLDDSLAVSPADVWGKLRQSLDAGAERYDADLVLIGRVSQLGDNEPASFRGDWEIWLDGQPLVENYRARSAEAVGRLAVEMIVNPLVERFAVLPRQQQLRRLAITGLNNTVDYAQFMRYMTNLEFIDQVDVTAIDGTALYLSLASRADESQLLMLLTAEGKLLEDTLHRGLGLQLIWQG